MAHKFAQALATEMEWVQEAGQPVWTGLVRELVRNQKLCAGWPGVAAALVRELEKLIAQAKSGMQIASPLNSQEAAVANLESYLTEARRALEGSVEQKVRRLAKEWLKSHPDKTVEQAEAAIWTQHPQLYAQYRQERADAARGTQFEDSLALHGTRQHAARQKVWKGKKS